MCSRQIKRKFLMNHFKREMSEYGKNIKRNYNLKRFEEIPGILSLPLIGTLYQYLPGIGPYNLDRMHESMHLKYRKYGHIVRERISRSDPSLLLLFQPEDFETLFRHESKNPSRRSHLALLKYRQDKPEVYNTGGLLPTNGEEWWRLRRAFQRGLSSPKCVQTFLPFTNEITDEWIQHLKHKLKDPIPNEDLFDDLTRLFLELVGLAALDCRFNSFSQEETRQNSRTTKLINAAFTTNDCILRTDAGPKLWRTMDTPIYRKLKRAQDFMEDVAIDLLSLKVSLFREKKEEPTLLESYLASPEIDWKDLIGMVIDLLLAGVDTSSNATSFLLYFIAVNSRVQERLYEESSNLLSYASSPVTKEVLENAKYAKAILKETFRIRPISIGVGRVITENLELKGYNIPKGVNAVTINQIACQFEEHFPLPLEFRPERWIRGDSLYRQNHPYLVLPFGHGPRACIARRFAEQNILTVMLKLSRNFKMHWTGNELGIKTTLINKPDAPINIKLERR